MKIGIMQPYFLPYLGYFQLMAHVDIWVIFDQVQFIDKGWVNRNRILHPDESKQWQFITVPLSKRGQFDYINTLSIHNDAKWKKQIRGKFDYWRKKAPYFKASMELLDECLALETDSLGDLLAHSLATTNQYLGISTPLVVQSKENMPIDSVEHAGQWALEIAKHYGADEYINPCGGAVIFKQQEFDEHNIQLKFLRPELKAYSQRRNQFVPGLSIIDVLMWNSIEEVQRMLSDDFRICSQNEVLSE
ncbi:WbqC family protein [Agarivorans albus]|uniref:Glycine transferase n=1 Tax=Agarivorans albus MKT 106 TaxID=1331007 RepID=R9PN01_AGAAL|nr:WbqC family protein [Agarivorans albus]GAD02685.1 hypothetical protein AALB_2765 [Agarivorans albus MKT 106]